MKKLAAYLKGSWEELRKVTWPSKKDTTKHTTIVIVFSVAIAAFIGLLDFVFNVLLELIV